MLHLLSVKELIPKVCGNKSVGQCLGQLEGVAQNPKNWRDFFCFLFLFHHDTRWVPMWYPIMYHGKTKEISNMGYFEEWNAHKGGCFMFCYTRPLTIVDVWLCQVRRPSLTYTIEKIWRFLWVGRGIFIMCNIPPPLKGIRCKSPSFPPLTPNCMYNCLGSW